MQHIAMYMTILVSHEFVNSHEFENCQIDLLSSGNGFTPGDRTCLCHHPLINTHDIFWLVKLFRMLPDSLFVWYKGREIYVKT